MSDPEKPTSKSLESTGLGKELEFDDEPLETLAPPVPHKINSPSDDPPTLAPPAPEEDAPPPKPPRPISPQQQAENTLKEAFPSIDGAVVKAVLRASGGSLEPAFNALLGMSDPDSQVEPAPPAQPPRPMQTARSPSSTAQTQLEADEQYARQLAEHYNGATAYGEAPRTGSRGRQDPRQRRDPNMRPNEPYDDRERSFIDDDLPVIRDNIKKGFFETQSKVNSWVSTLRKRIDGDEDEGYQGAPSRTGSGYNTGPPQHQYGNRRSADIGRRSGDRERYDADPQVLGDDFTSLQLRDEEAPQRRSNRPLANPDLFKPTPAPPQSKRRVSFQDGPPEEIDDLYRGSPDSTKRPSSSTGKPSKWQPLAAVDPSPVADHDPFSLGDSDDEDSKKKDVKPDDSERLKKGVAMTDGTSLGGMKNLEPSERLGSTGVRDKEAEGKLTGNF